MADKKWNTDAFSTVRVRDNTRREGTNEGDRVWLRPVASVFAFANFLVGVAFSCYLLHQGYTADSYKDLSVLHTHRTCVLAQTNDTAITPDMTPNLFTNILLGVSGDPVEVLPRLLDMDDKATKDLAHFEHFPRLWQYLSADSNFSLTSIHTQYLLFVAMWLSTSFSLSSLRFTKDIFAHTQDELNKGRLIIVVAWNLVGLFFIVFFFASPQGWGPVPLSNFLTSLGFLIIGTIYQFFFLVEIDPEAHDVNTDKKYLDEFTWNRRILYLEFAVTVPLFIVAAAAPGFEGVEQWRIQSSFLCSYVFFSILGLYDRWKDLGDEIIYNNVMVNVMKYTPATKDEPATPYTVEEEGIHARRTASWYLVYAAAMCFFVCANSLSYERNFTYMTYHLKMTTFAHASVVYVLAFMGCIVVGMIVNEFTHSFEGLEIKKRKVEKLKWDWDSAWGHAEALQIFGSMMLKILFFIALYRADFLTTVTAADMDFP
jgi:hypothetical protein